MGFAALLAENRIAGARRPDPFGDEGLGAAVHGGHHVGEARLGLDDLGASLGTLVGEQAARGRGGVGRERQQLFQVRRAHAAPGRVMAQQAAGQTSVDGPRGPSAARGVCAGAQALAHQVDDHGPELGVVPGGGRAGQRQAELRRRLRRLGVEVVPDLHVVGHEPDRDDHGRRGARLGQVAEVVEHIGFEPRLGGRPAPALVDQMPRADPSYVRSEISAAASASSAAYRPPGPGAPFPGGPLFVRHGQRHAVRGEHQVRAVADVGRQLASAARVFSANGSMNPGWLK